MTEMRPKYLKILNCITLVGKFCFCQHQNLTGHGIDEAKMKIAKYLVAAFPKD